MTRCLNSYPLILPLFDLSQPYNAEWLAPALLSALYEGSVCKKCSENTSHCNYSDYVIQCLSRLNTSHCSKEIMSKFAQIILYIIDIDRDNVFSHDTVYNILSKMELDLSTVISRECNLEQWDPRCLIVTSSIPSRTPLVYNMTWFFGRIVPWLVLLIEDIGTFVEGSEVRSILDTLVFFSAQNIKMLSVQFERVIHILDFLISVAVNNQNSANRQDASKCIRFISMKLTIEERIKVISKYIKNENSSVAGLFIDMLRAILSQPKQQSSRIQKQVNLVETLLNFDNFDVLEISDKILATLSIIQLCCRSPEIKNHMIIIVPKFEKFLSHVDRQSRRREKEILTETCHLDEVPDTKEGSNVPATISVQGEVISEPSVEEQRQSYQMASSRLDLILFNSAATRRVIESGSF